MFLLPDIYIDGMLLSTQYPFTLNGELIRSVELQSESDRIDVLYNSTIRNIHSRNTIKFKTHVEILCIGLHRFKTCIERAIFNNIAYFKEKYTTFHEEERVSFDGNKYIKKLLFNNSSTIDFLFSYIFTSMRTQCSNFNDLENAMLGILECQHRKVSAPTRGSYNQTSSLIYIHNVMQVDHIRLFQAGIYYREMISL